MSDTPATSVNSVHSVNSDRVRRDSVQSPCWGGYESPSLLNKEVSNILSRGNPPAEDERHKWTHPSPVQVRDINLYREAFIQIS